MLSEKQIEFFARRKAAQEAKLELRRQIRAVLRSSTKAWSLDEVCQVLYQERKEAVQRELQALGVLPASDVWHNGLRGRGSRYGVGIMLVSDGK